MAPDPDDRGHLATAAVRLGSHDTADAAQFPAIDRRHTDRRRMSDRPVPQDHLQALAEHARRTGALLLPVTDAAMCMRLTATLTDAAHSQEFAPGYAAELRQWTHRYPAGRDGVPAVSVARYQIDGTEAAPLRRFPRGHLDQPRHRPEHRTDDDAAVLLVIATTHDDPLDWLHAGEATSAVLLAATALGLATTPLSQALEVERPGARSSGRSCACPSTRSSSSEWGGRPPPPWSCRSPSDAACSRCYCRTEGAGRRSTRKTEHHGREVVADRPRPSAARVGEAGFERAQRPDRVRRA